MSVVLEFTSAFLTFFNVQAILDFPDGVYLE